MCIELYTPISKAHMIQQKIVIIKVEHNFLYTQGNETKLKIWILKLKQNSMLLRQYVILLLTDSKFSSHLDGFNAVKNRLKLMLNYSCVDLLAWYFTLKSVCQNLNNISQDVLEDPQ